jgi:hypothetical protein
MNELGRPDIEGFVSSSVSPSTTDNWQPSSGRQNPEVPTASDSRKNMVVEIVSYKGCRLEVVPVGKGWRVSIYPPDSSLALHERPTKLEKVPKETVIAGAKKIVDARVAAN